MRILLWLFVKIPLILLMISLIWVVSLKWIPVYYTPMMLKKSLENFTDSNYHTSKTWVPLSEISPELTKAVIAAEDNLFELHNGFDWGSIREAMRHNQKGKSTHGGSTISQQTAKNVFCWPNRSWLRKGTEAYFTLLIEKIWGKRRIMEVYLNVAEMGKGVFGAQAAAQHHFHMDASKLGRKESGLLAACLPNPTRRNASNPSTGMRMRAADILALEHKMWYPSWVTGKSLNEQQLKQEDETRRKLKEKTDKRQETNLRKLVENVNK